MIRYNPNQLFLLFLLLIGFYSTSFSQYTTLWTSTIGGSDGDFIRDICLMPDGVILAAGNTYSSDHGITGYHDRTDAWLTKLNSAGEIEWSKCFGSDEDDGFNSVISTEDGSYLAAGYAGGGGGDVSAYYGSWDVWLAKINSAGDLLWEHSYGDVSVEKAIKLLPAGDGNYFLICSTTAAGPDYGLYDFQDEYLIIKINPSGDIIWEKTYGGSSFEEPASAIVNSNGELVIAGNAKSDDGDVVGHTYFGDADAWFLKTDSTGNILTSRCDGALMYESYNDITPANDNGYMLLSTSLFEGAECTDPTQYDFQLCKTDSAGIIEWEKCFGGFGYDWGLRLVEDVNGYFMAGTTLSATLPGFHGIGEYDFYVAKLNDAGDLIWDYCYGGSGLDDNGVDIEADHTGGFVLGASSNSTDGDNVTPLGFRDGIIIRVTCDGVADIFADGETDICTTDSVRLFTTYIEGASWKWFKNDEEIPLATDTVLTCYSAGDYQVEVSLPTGCIKRSEIIAITDTCLEEYDMMVPYGIYPNPTAGIFTIECLDEKSCSNKYDIFIYDMNGNIFEAIKNEEAGVPHNLTLTLQQGLYIIYVEESDGKCYHLPFIVAY